MALLANCRSMPVNAGFCSIPGRGQIVFIINYGVRSAREFDLNIEVANSPKYFDLSLCNTETENSKYINKKNALNGYILTIDTLNGIIALGIKSHLS